MLLSLWRIIYNHKKYKNLCYSISRLRFYMEYNNCVWTTDVSTFIWRFYLVQDVSASKAYQLSAIYFVFLLYGLLYIGFSLRIVDWTLFYNIINPVLFFTIFYLCILTYRCVWDTSLYSAILTILFISILGFWFIWSGLHKLCLRIIPIAKRPSQFAILFYHFLYTREFYTHYIY